MVASLAGLLLAAPPALARRPCSGTWSHVCALAAGTRQTADAAGVPIVVGVHPNDVNALRELRRTYPFLDVRTVTTSGDWANEIAWELRARDLPCGVWAHRERFDQWRFYDIGDCPADASHTVVQRQVAPQADGEPIAEAQPVPDGWYDRTGPATALRLEGTLGSGVVGAERGFGVAADWWLGDQFALTARGFRTADVERTGNKPSLEQSLGAGDRRYTGGAAAGAMVAAVGGVLSPVVGVEASYAWVRHEVHSCDLSLTCDVTSREWTRVAPAALGGLLLRTRYLEAMGFVRATDAGRGVEPVAGLSVGLIHRRRR